MHVAILGGGINGLVAAWELARAGHATILFERRADLGGGAASRETIDGTRIPAYSHEVPLDARLAADLRLEARGIRWLTGDRALCALDAGDDALVLPQGLDIGEARGIGDRDLEALRRFGETLERLATAMAPLMRSPLTASSRPREIWRLLEGAQALRRLDRRDRYRLLRWLSMPVADLADDLFESPRLKALVAAHALMGTALGPRAAGSALLLLLRATQRRLAAGARVAGGPGALVSAIAAAALDAGAQIHTESNVEGVVVTGGNVTGVVVNGTEVGVDTVVSSLDPKTTLLRLAGAERLSADVALRVRNLRARGSMARVVLTFSSLPPFGVPAAGLAGRVYAAPTLDYLERAADAVKYREASPEPWLELAIPSVADPGIAPPGRHALTAFVHHVPGGLASGSLAAMREATLERTLTVLERCAPGTRSLVIGSDVLTPDDLEREIGMSGGCIFHTDVALDQLFAFRPFFGNSGYQTPIGGLFLCGAGTHPGGYLTGMNGRLAAQACMRRS